MGEGLTVLASSRNTVRTMATRDIYETTFDEDVQTDTRSNQCPECDGRVTTNTVETVCEEWACRRRAADRPRTRVARV